MSSFRKAHLRCAAFGALIASLLLTLAPATAAPRENLYPEYRFAFGLIGDVPYDAAQETNYFPNMIAELNDASLAFVVHDGDIKAGATPCTDELLDRRYRQFQTFSHPLIYLFGDNEWSDCGKGGTNTAPARSQEEWLQQLRTRFCAGDRSLGQRTIYLERQSREPQFAAFRENVRWIHGGILFAGLNVPGDSNNYGRPEFAPRNRANIAWINEAFDLATKHRLRAVMILMQANPRFDLGPTNRVRLGFNEMLSTLEKRTVEYGRPVVLVHGDTHYFRIDQPLLHSQSRRRVENFTRVETYGNPDVHWIKVSVDWRNPNVFDFQRQLVKSNFIRHRP